MGFALRVRWDFLVQVMGPGQNSVSEMPFGDLCAPGVA